MSCGVTMSLRHARRKDQAKASSSQEIRSEVFSHVTIVRPSASDSCDRARLGLSALAKIIAELIREEETLKNHPLHDFAQDAGEG